MSVGGDTAFEFGAAEDAVALIVGLGRARLAHTGATGLGRRGFSGSAVVFHKELFTSKSYISPGKGKTKKIGSRKVIATSDLFHAVLCPERTTP